MLMVMILPIMVVAWSASDTSASVPSTDLLARPSSPARMTRVAPTDGEVVHSGTVSVKVRLANVKIVQASSLDVVPDEGHLHVSPDGTHRCHELGLSAR